MNEQIFKHWKSINIKIENSRDWIKNKFLKFNESGRQTDRQTHRQIDSEPDRQTDRQTDRLTNRERGRQTDRQTDTHTDRHTDRQTDTQTHWQTDRETDRWYSSEIKNVISMKSFYLTNTYFLRYKVICIVHPS